MPVGSDHRRCASGGTRRRPIHHHPGWPPVCHLPHPDAPLHSPAPGTSVGWAIPSSMVETALGAALNLGPSTLAGSARAMPVAIILVRSSPRNGNWKMLRCLMVDGLRADTAMPSLSAFVSAV
eukprot:6198874-Pleurochrysis_carterae.AAC.4